MPKYCRAFHLSDFRQFSNWSANCSEDSLSLSNDTVCYLCDDFTVVQSPIQDGCVFFSAVSPEWKEFCTLTLQFSVPSNLLSSGNMLSIDPLKNASSSSSSSL